MSNYCPAIPANTFYSLPLNRVKSFFYQRKQVESEEIQKTIVIGDMDFTTVDIQTVLKDVKNTSLSEFLAGAVQYMEENIPLALVRQALLYIYALDEKTAVYEDLVFPPLSVSIPEDGDLLIEWNFEHFKIGLCFETNPEESGWYIVHDGTVNKMTAWGYLNSQTVSDLVDTILSQVVENAT